jgi:hypothetical protein
MTRRFVAVLLMVAVPGMCMTASAADLVSPKLLPPASSLRAGIPDWKISFDAGTAASSQRAAPHRHWSRTGKVLTIVGGGLVTAGTVAIVRRQSTPIACDNYTCVDIEWRDIGIGWAAGGAALTIVGLTRHTTD